MGRLTGLKFGFSVSAIHCRMRQGERGKRRRAFAGLKVTGDFNDRLQAKEEEGNRGGGV